MRNLYYLLTTACLLACASPHVQLVSGTTQVAELTPEFAIMPDGYKLPVMTWPTPGDPKAMVLALHGFNDYRTAFAEPARLLAAHDIMTYAYDQRGFGETAQRGVWPGREKLQTDLRTLVQLLCERHPDLPLFLMGESMGGAVVMTTRLEQSCVRGVILLAPAVWGWQTMPFWQRLALHIAVRIAPEKTLTGEGLDITPSDNLEMLRRLGHDPLIIKKTRVDTMYGLTNLMETALLEGPSLKYPALVLYGEKDEIIPATPTCRMLRMQQTQEGPATRVVLYPNGYHMLTRDLQADVVNKDILAWVNNRSAALPSGQEVTVTSPRLESLCQSAG